MGKHNISTSSDSSRNDNSSIIYAENPRIEHTEDDNDTDNLTPQNEESMEINLSHCGDDSSSDTAPLVEPLAGEFQEEDNPRCRDISKSYSIEMHPRNAYGAYFEPLGDANCYFCQANTFDQHRNVQRIDSYKPLVMCEKDRRVDKQSNECCSSCRTTWRRTRDTAELICKHHFPRIRKSSSGEDHPKVQYTSTHGNSTNKSCSSSRSNRRRQWNCKGSFNANAYQYRGRCTSRCSYGDKGSHGNICEIETSYAEEDCFAHLEELRKRFKGMCNAECLRQDSTICFRPCKGRSATKFNCGAPCYSQFMSNSSFYNREFSSAASSSCSDYQSFTTHTRDSCVQTCFSTLKHNRCVQCVDICSQSTNQCCQTPMSFTQPQIIQNPSKGCRPCSGCPLPQNCSASNPQWEMHFSGIEESNCYGDDYPRSVFSHFSSGNAIITPRNCMVSQCEVDVDLDSEKEAPLHDDTDTSTLSSNLLRLGLAAAGERRWIKARRLHRKIKIK